MGFLDLFSKPKSKHSKNMAGEDAIEKSNLIDQTILTDLALDGKDYDVRSNALRNPNFTNQAALTYVAKNDKDSRLRIDAVKKLTDQATLAYVVKNDDVSDVREAAVKSFTDQNALADFAKNSVDWRLREAAVEKLTDQATLAYVAKKDNTSEVRLAAVGNLNFIDQAALADAAKNDRDYNVSMAAWEKLTENKGARKAIMPLKGKSLYVFALLNEADRGGESLAQQICDCVYGRGRCSAGMWKFAGVNEISVNHALRIKDQLGINWGKPENTWEGVLPKGEKVAALIWKM